MKDFFVVVTSEYAEPQHPSVDAHYIVDEMTEAQIADAEEEPARGFVIRFAVRCENIFDAVESVHGECSEVDEKVVIPAHVNIVGMSVEQIEPSDMDEETSQALGYSEWPEVRGVHHTSGRIYF